MGFHIFKLVQEILYFLYRIEKLINLRNSKINKMVFFFKKKDTEYAEIKNRFKLFLKLAKKKEWKEVCDSIPLLVKDIENLETKTQDPNKLNEIRKLKMILILFKTNQEIFEKIQNGEIHFTNQNPVVNLEKTQDENLEKTQDVKNETRQN